MFPTLVEGTATTALSEAVQTHTAVIQLASNVERAVTAIITAFQSNGKLLLCGNGGSAADAQHLAAEFVGRFQHERSPLPAIALTTNTSILTAISNDYGYDAVFLRQLEVLARPGDVLLAISTSGTSRNVLVAVERAKVLGVCTIGLTMQDTPLSTLVDISIAVPLSSVPRLQECHITLGHTIVSLVERVFVV